MSRIVSSLPGRIRIRDKGLRDQARMNALKNDLLKIAAITGLQDNVRTGSIVVNFDPNAIAIAALEAHINSAADKILAKSSISTLVTKKQINRYSKIGMLASLATSLAFATARPRRWKRWHALTGYLFIANLGLHLVIYRKSLFRLFR